MSERHPDWEIGDVEYGQGAVPLSEATIWPDFDMEERTLPSGRVVRVGLTNPEKWAARVERLGNERLGFIACSGNHREVLPCPECGAAI